MSLSTTSAPPERGGFHTFQGFHTIQGLLVNTYIAGLSMNHSYIA